MDIRTMHRCVAAGAPATAQAQFGGMFLGADINPPGAHPNRGPDRLGVTLQAEIVVSLDQHFRINRAMRVVTDGTAFAQRLMLIDKGLGLLAMTGGARFVQARHREAPARLADIPSVRIVALDAIHFVLNHRVMLRQVELRVRLQMTIETRCRISPRIDNKLAPSSARCDVFAPRTMAGFAPGQPFQAGPLKGEPRVRAGRKNTGDIGVTFGTGFVADEAGAFDAGRRNHRPVQTGAGKQEHAGQPRRRHPAEREQTMTQFHILAEARGRHWQNWSHFVNGLVSRVPKTWHGAERVSSSN